MSEEKGSAGTADRRHFLKLIGVAGAAASTLPLGAASAAQPAVTAGHPMHGHANIPVDSHSRGAGYEFFNTSEAAFIEAAVDTLIPKDSVGPGAAEAGVATFIDRQMSAGYGKGDRLYLEGPFGTGTPQQGYQLPMTPSELIRIGIADVNAHTEKKYKKTFDSLSATDRAAVMTGLDTKKVELPNVPTETFFGLLLQLTVEGYFSDPMYGGNKGKAAWKMIGFPGASAMYTDKIELFRNKPYKADPMGIQDLT